MAVRLVNGAEFLHIPKTGGTWVEHVLKTNRLVSGNLGPRHSDYDRNLMRHAMTGRQRLNHTAHWARANFAKLLGRRAMPDGHAVFRFCFVRHPLSWYESWWKYMQGRGWRNWGTQNSRSDWHPNSVLNGLGSDDFNQFVRNVVSERPGYVSELLFAYTKPGISFIGKTENLRSDLVHVLGILGLACDKSTIDDSPRVNVSKANHAKIRWDPELRETVMRLELPALVHFAYLTEQEKADLGIKVATVPNKALRRTENPTTAAPSSCRIGCGRKNARHSAIP